MELSSKELPEWINLGGNYPGGNCPLGESSPGTYLGKLLVGEMYGGLSG